jgi:hypothetical protein
MKSKPVFLYPWIFSALAGTVYFLAYRTGWNSLDTTTLMLVICTAFGWSSLIFIRRGAENILLKVYIFISVVFPPIYMEILKWTAVDPLWHRITFGLMILATLFLNYFISMTSRKRTTPEK